MKKIVQILAMAFLLSLTVYSQNREVKEGTHERNISRHMQGQQLISDDFYGIKGYPMETSELRSPSKDWLLWDLSFNLQWDAAESIWKYTRKYYYYYDENYNLSEKSVQWPDGSGLIEKNTYYYDENNNLLEERVFDYDSSEWVIQRKIIYYYDENDKLWQELTKTWDGSEFKNYSKTVYVYDENTNIDYYITQYWITDKWINSSKWIYYYDQASKLYEIDGKTWDGDESVWVNLFQHFLTRDEETGNLIMMLSEHWNDEDNIWEKSLRQSFYYDDDYYHIITVAERWINEGSGWQNIFKQLYYYLPAGSEKVNHKNTDLDKSIEDMQTTEDVIVIGQGEKSGRNMSLIGVEVLIDSVLHTSDGDLEFTLSHNGITKTIICQAGGDGDNFINTTITDRGMDSVSNGRAPFLGIYKPENPLLPFVGVDPEGIWTLSIYDGVAGNTGTLKAWGLNLIYDSNSAVGVEHSEAHSFKIFPNPASSVVRLQLSALSQQPAIVKIYDLNGRKLIEKKYTKGTETIELDVSHLKSGIYFIQMTMGNNTLTKKIILK